MQNNTHVLIAKMDGTANDIPDTRIEITGFPAVFYLGKGPDGNAIKFEGPRLKERLVEFVNEHVGGGEAAHGEGGRGQEKDTFDGAIKVNGIKEEL